jgi:hypothetical protein
MKGQPELHAVGNTVLVRALPKGKGKVQGSLWPYAAKVLEVFAAKYTYTIEWLTPVPNLDDKPGTVALRRYHQRLLKAMPPGLSISQLAFAKLDNDEYEVEAILGYKDDDDERQFLVLWSGYPPSSATWEPR